MAQVAQRVDAASAPRGRRSPVSSSGIDLIASEKLVDSSSLHRCSLDAPAAALKQGHRLTVRTASMPPWEIFWALPPYCTELKHRLRLTPEIFLLATAFAHP